MRALYWRVKKVINILKRGLRKAKNVLKRILKSNNRIRFLCVKAKEMIRSRNKSIPKPMDAEAVIDALCPENERINQQNKVFEEKITFSILVPLYNTPERYLIEMIKSVQAQTYPHWELCLADGSDKDHETVGKICQQYATEDTRIKYKKLEKNLGISENTNECIAMATGEYIALYDHDDFLHPSALYENVLAVCEKHADYIYSDEATFYGDNIFDVVLNHYKPDFAIDNLRANNYICHFSVFKKELLDKVGLFRPEFDGSQDHDLILRLVSAAETVYHIPKILYYWRSHPGSVASDVTVKTYAIDAAKNAINQHLEDNGLAADIESSKILPTIFRFRYHINEKPKVSIIVWHCTDNNSIKRCIESVLSKSSYDNYEVIVASKFKSGSFTKKYKDSNRVKTIKVPEAANFANAVADAINAASGEYLLFVDENIQIISNMWIEELLMYAQRKDVALVGGKVFYPDDTIYNTGMGIDDRNETPVKISHYLAQSDDPGYMGKLYFARNVTAVCKEYALIKKSVYDELGGFNKNYSIAFYDMDLCLRAVEKGYLNVFTPYSCAYYCGHTPIYMQKNHGEDYIKDLTEFKTEWSETIAKGDSYYKINMPE